MPTLKLPAPQRLTVEQRLAVAREILADAIKKTEELGFLIQINPGNPIDIGIYGEGELGACDVSYATLVPHWDDSMVKTKL